MMTVYNLNTRIIIALVQKLVKEHDKPLLLTDRELFGTEPHQLKVFRNEALGGFQLEVVPQSDDNLVEHHLTTGEARECTYMTKPEKPKKGMKWLNTEDGFTYIFNGNEWVAEDDV